MYFHVETFRPNIIRPAVSEIQRMQLITLIKVHSGSLTVS